MTAEIATVPVSSVDAWTPERVALLKRTICKDATDDELAMFLAICKTRDLDPFAKEIYWRKYKTKDGPVCTVITGIDGYRNIAGRSGQYEGQTPTEWCGPDGKWRDVWLENKFPSAARVGVYRVGHREPIHAVARWDEYFPANANEQFMWRRMAANRIAKCAEALALRKAFPRQLGGLYTEDEMHQAEPAEHPRPARHIQDDAVSVTAIRGALDADTIPDPPEWNDVPGEPQEPADEMVSDAQVKAIHTLKTKVGLTDYRYRGYLKTYRVTTSKDLTKAQAREFIDKLQTDLDKRSARATTDTTAADLAAFVDPDREKRESLGREIAALAKSLRITKDDIRTRFGADWAATVASMEEVAVALEHDVNAGGSP